MFHVAIPPDRSLRLFEQRHVAELHALLSDNRAHLAAELSWVAEPFSQADVSAYIRAGLDRFANDGGFRAGIWQGTQLAGCLSLHSLDWNDHKASVGYWLGAAFEGQGIVTQACQVLLAYAFGELQLERLEIQCAADNVRSRQLAQRLGFQQEGVLRHSWRRQGQLVDQVLYSLLRSEWLRDRGAP